MLPTVLVYCSQCLVTKTYQLNGWECPLFIVCSFASCSPSFVPSTRVHLRIDRTRCQVASLQFPLCYIPPNRYSSLSCRSSNFHLLHQYSQPAHTQSSCRSRKYVCPFSQPDRYLFQAFVDRGGHQQISEQANIYRPPPPTSIELELVSMAQLSSECVEYWVWEAMCNQIRHLPLEVWHHAKFVPSCLTPALLE